MLWMLLSTLLVLGASYLFYKAWKRSQSQYSVAAVAMFVLAGVMASFAQGAEYAVFLLFCLLPMLVWVPIIQHKFAKSEIASAPIKTRAKASSVVIQQTKKQVAIKLLAILKTSANALLIGLGFMLCASVVSIALAYQLPFAEVNKIAIALMLAAVLWALSAHIYIYAKRKLLVGACIITVSALSAGVLFI